MEEIVEKCTSKKMSAGRLFANDERMVLTGTEPDAAEQRRRGCRLACDGRYPVFGRGLQGGRSRRSRASLLPHAVATTHHRHADIAERRRTGRRARRLEQFAAARRRHGNREKPRAQAATKHSD